jgi:endonuclease III
MVKRSKKLQ